MLSPRPGARVLLWGSLLGRPDWPSTSGGRFRLSGVSSDHMGKVDSVPRVGVQGPVRLQTVPVVHEAVQCGRPADVCSTKGG